MYHPNELDQQIEHLRTLQESYGQIAGAAEAYNVGKTQLAAAITSKGVETSPTESYPEMAEKVNAISQETYEINGGEMYAKQLFGSFGTPNYWNLYDILAQLLSDGRLVNYGGILLAEYYKGYDSIALSGAGAGGAYVVSDKDENGQFKIYTEDTTHMWDIEDDGKGNRWVAYCFADAGHDFDITDTNTSPRGIHIGRNIGTINCLVATRISEIVATDGNYYKGINSNGFGSMWNKKTILRNIKDIYAGNSEILHYPESCESIYVHADKFNSGQYIIRGIPSGVTLIIKADEYCRGIIGSPNDAEAYRKINVLMVDAPVFICTPQPQVSGVQVNATSMNVVSITSEETQFGCRLGSTIGKIYFNYKTNDKTKLVSIIRVEGEITCDDIILQDGWCKPLNVSRQTMLTKQNVQDHIFDRLGVNDISTGAVTITLASAVLNLFTQEEIDAVVSRTNITIVGA